jgi:hypothetical protein
MGAPNAIVRGVARRSAFALAAARSHAGGAVVERLACSLPVETPLFKSVPKASIGPIGPNLSANWEWLACVRLAWMQIWPAYRWSMILSENRCPPRIKCGAGFFGIMLSGRKRS